MKMSKGQAVRFVVLISVAFIMILVGTMLNVRDPGMAFVVAGATFVAVLVVLVTSPDWAIRLLNDIKNINKDDDEDDDK